MEKCTSMDYKEDRPFVLGLSGYAQTGKDTIAKLLVAKHGFTRLAFADKVRDGIYALNPIVDFRTTTRDGYIVESSTLRVAAIVDAIGWERAKTQYTEVRELLQRYGTEAGRLIHGYDCWVEGVEREIAEGNASRYVITDMRFPNEYEMLERLGGRSVRVHRSGVGAVNSHISDSYVPPHTHSIQNDGTEEELEEQVIRLLEELL